MFHKCFLFINFFIFSMMYPYLIVGNVVWDKTYPSNHHQLYLLHKRFVRLATFSNSTETSVHNNRTFFQYMTSTYLSVYMNISYCLFSDGITQQLVQVLSPSFLSFLNYVSLVFCYFFCSPLASGGIRCISLWLHDLS